MRSAIRVIPLFLGILAAHITYAEDKPGRPFISMEEIFARMPMIVEGTVTAADTVDAPNTESYFIYENKALAVDVEPRTTWKGPHEKTMTLYTWPPGKAPCNGVTLEVGRSYIFWAEWDSRQQHRTFDFCSHFMPSDSISAPDLRKQLNTMFPLPAK